MIDLFLSDVLDTTGFYLAQMDGTSSDVIYFWSTLTFTPTKVPEPGMLLLVSIGLIGIAGVNHKNNNRRSA